MQSASRSDLLFPALKREMQKAGYFSGSIDATWDEIARRAWQAFADRRGFKYAPTPDLLGQEPARRAEMEAWMAQEQIVQETAGTLARPRVRKSASLFDMIKKYSPEADDITLDEELSEAKRAKQAELQIEVPDEVAEAQAERKQRIEEERRKSIASALRTARRHVKTTQTVADTKTVADGGVVKRSAKIRRIDNSGGDAVLRTRD